MTEKSISDELYEVILTLTPDQVRFIVEMPNHPSKKSCAEALGIHPNSVYNWSDNVDDAIRLMRKDIVAGALAMRKKSLAHAMAVKVKGLENKSAVIAQKVATEIIEWETGKAMQNIDIKSDGEKIGQTDDQLNRAMSTLANAIREGIPGKDGSGSVDTAE